MRRFGITGCKLVPLRAAGFLLCALLLSRVAMADSYCGGGRHVGSENDGAGMSWRCVADSPRPQSAARERNGGGGGNRAAAMAGGLGALLDIVSALGEMSRATDDTGPPPVETFSWADAARSSRENNRKAFAAMQAGRFQVAADFFNQAALDALQARNGDEHAANVKNARIADAQFWLHQGYLAEQQNDLSTASTYYLRGKQAAEGIDAPELAARLAAYNDALMVRAGGAKNGVQDTRSSCATINGQLLCR